MIVEWQRDLTFAVRQFRRSPGFAVTAVLTLALGIGSTTAIFSLIDGILLRPLPFPQPDRLVAIDTLEFPPGVAPSNIAAANSLGDSYPNFFDWRRQSHGFESLASYDNITRLFSKANGEGARVLEGGGGGVSAVDDSQWNCGGRATFFILTALSNLGSLGARTHVHSPCFPGGPSVTKSSY